MERGMIDDKIKRCEIERDKIAIDYQTAPLWLKLLGWADWECERRRLVGMKIVKSYARIQSFTPWLEQQNKFTLFDGVNLLRKIEYEARVSHRSEERMTEDSYDRFLRSVVLDHGDFSVTEHASVTVEALVDRGITHEWVRHRLGSYTQESTRFVNYKKRGEIEFIKSEKINATKTYYNSAIQAIEESYYNMLNEGLAPEIARAVLPNALASKIIVTYNLRQWRHFFLLRTSKETHPQFREVTIPLLKEFQEKIPILYEDIVPESKQSANMRMIK